MSTKTSYIVTVFLFLASVAMAVLVFPYLPESVASHWNSAGEADGYMSRFWGVFLLPFILVGLALFFYTLPKIDPLRQNVSVFRREYNLVIVAILMFLFFLHALTLMWNSGARFDMGTFVVSGISALFVVIGYALPRTKRNWFFGVRTPWTLSSDSVWDATHRLAGKLFIGMGCISFASVVFFPDRGFLIFFSLIVLTFLTTLIYSYVAYRNER